MKKTLLMAAILTVALLGQTPRIVEDKQFRVIADPAGQGASGFSFVSAEASFETSIVKGVPFTGDFVTENIETLADGNRIRNANTTSYARDGDGRTRREITINAIGPFATGETRKHIFIHDPVSKTDYVLDAHDKTARKINVSAAWTQAAPAIPAKEGHSVFFNHRVEGPKEVVIRHGGVSEVSIERGPSPEGIVMQDHAGAVAGQRGMAAAGVAFSPISDSKDFKNEDLGKRIIEGVEAVGTRTTFTIPAGQIGNEMPLNTVSERWYSNELKTVVLTTRKDPRTGESNYKLTNLRRGEPSRLLFEVPSDYKIVTEDNVGPNVIRMKIERDKKQE